ncbi:MAG: cell division protein FtsZ [Alphaproteobacteria bacterium]|nr:cell division protein FtsZ [Alphaproteobacteria bacterium]MDE2112727.1 cell division protein FtsZ [Alphaproteobacteria bacterium]MDE2495239.1 cell division protein FtsZ [Alphaproteobacteria bacterium]
MAINFKTPQTTELRPRITVLGVGGAGGNAVNNMIASKLEGVDFVVANTDAQALAQSKAERRIQLGAHVTEGLGAGAQPDVGRAGAEETLEEILEHLGDSHMVFITAGMGGGTGTGAAPVIARAVRERGILTVGVVTKPFAFEGDKRMRIAEKGITELQQYVHTLIVIPNQNLFRVANDRTTFAQAFAMADDVLHAGVRGVTDLIVMPGLINLDFADIKSVISEMGKAMMGTGEAEGEDRAQKAADMAISNPLLDDVSMKGARGVLINITGGPDLMLFEVEAAANRVRAEVDPDANIIFGNTILDNMEGRIRVSVVATGIDAAEMRMPKNVEPLRPNIKPLPRMPEPKPEPRPVAAAASNNPVHRQVEALADELGATAEHASAEAMILGGENAPRVIRIDEDDVPPMPAIRTAPAARAPEPEPERRGWFLGRKKHKEEPRMEPAAAPRPVAMAQRATSQVMTRSAAPAEQLRPAAPKGDDLFPDHKRDEQFEIPAFLRRQTN